LNLFKFIEKDFAFPDPTPFLEGPQDPMPDMPIQDVPAASAGEEKPGRQEMMNYADELREKAFTALIEVAEERGVPEEEIASAENSINDPKEAVIQLMLTLYERGASEHFDAPKAETEPVPEVDDVETLFWLRRHGLGLSLAAKLRKLAKGGSCSTDMLKARFLDWNPQLLESTSEITQADQCRLREALATDEASALAPNSESAHIHHSELGCL
jgi:hypothetical protein